MTILAGIGAGCFLFYILIPFSIIIFRRFVLKRKNYAHLWMIAMAISICAIYYLPIAGDGFFDRYILPILPFAILLCLKCRVVCTRHSATPPAAPAPPTRLTRTFAIDSFTFLFCVFLLFVSIIFTHDYFSWNRARWNAADYLLGDLKIPADKIDGGFEFNGWYCYTSRYKASPEKSFWWVQDDEYIIAFGNIPGYVKIKSFEYPRWLDFSIREIHILKRSSSG
jgi:hypothetical protein